MRLLLIAASFLLADAQSTSAQGVPHLTRRHPLVDPSVVSAGVDSLELVVLQPDGGERPVFTPVRTTRPGDDAGVPASVMLPEYASDQVINTHTSVVRRSRPRSTRSWTWT